MNLTSEDISNLSFDEPLEYKNILLYPATMKYYHIFLIAEESLDISRIEEKDKRLLRLPYLDYLYEKSLLNEEFKIRWNILLGVLNIVFGEKQNFEILKDNGKIIIKVYQKSNDFELLNKEYTILKSQKNPNKLQLKKELEEKMYNVIIVGAEDFEEIRQRIMYQNDIVPQHYSKKTEQYLYEMKKKLRKAKPSNNIELEDLITAVAYSLNMTNKEIEKMTIRRFNRLLNIVMTKDDYYLYKELELSGKIETKQKISHWLSHYKPKGKFDDILIEGNNFMSSLGNEGKI